MVAAAERVTRWKIVAAMAAPYLLLLAAAALALF